MKRRFLAIVLVAFCTLLTSSAQLLYKIGADNLKFDLISIVTNGHIILGLVLYGIGAVLFITALRWGEVTVLHPIIATSYIWVAIMANIFFGEMLGLFRWTGIFSIMIGILTINLGGENGN